MVRSLFCRRFIFSDSFLQTHKNETAACSLDASIFAVKSQSFASHGTQSLKKCSGHLRRKNIALKQKIFNQVKLYMIKKWRLFSVRHSLEPKKLCFGAYVSVSAIESSISLAVALRKFFRHGTKIQYIKQQVEATILQLSLAESATC